jgi:peroxiredoxin Q/BCP
MSVKFILLIILFIWGAPSSYFRSKFRKIVYRTTDWKINIKPVFFKEIKALVFNIYPENNNYIRVRNYYRFYLLVYAVIFVAYLSIN